MSESSVECCGLQDYCVLMSDFCLWGNIRGRVYRNTPCTAEALLNEIRDVIALIIA
jgi:hypothetical protein